MTIHVRAYAIVYLLEMTMLELHRAKGSPPATPALKPTRCCPDAPSDTRVLVPCRPHDRPPPVFCRGWALERAPANEVDLKGQASRPTPHVVRAVRAEQHVAIGPLNDEGEVPMPAALEPADVGDVDEGHASALLRAIDVHAGGVRSATPEG